MLAHEVERDFPNRTSFAHAGVVPQDVDVPTRAIAAARAAFPGWAATPIAERKTALNAMGQAVMAHADEFKRLLTSEQGKPHAEAEGEVMGAGYWLMGAASL
ncbi:MAG: aldehyde dehydrogenase family protein, partial [Sphingomonadales bacterium]